MDGKDELHIECFTLNELYIVFYFELFNLDLFESIFTVKCGLWTRGGESILTGARLLSKYIRN